MGVFSHDGGRERHRDAQQHARSRQQRRDSDGITGSWRNEFDLHVVKKGESLADIAEEVYGDSSCWTRIQQANPIVLRDPQMVHAGLVLRIPKGEGTPVA